MKKDFSKIKLFAMDVDGTLTDGKIYIGNDGEVMKAFNAKDGLGIKLLIKRVLFLLSSPTAVQKLSPDDAKK